MIEDLNRGHAFCKGRVNVMNIEYIRTEVRASGNKPRYNYHVGPDAALSEARELRPTHFQSL